MFCAARPTNVPPLSGTGPRCYRREHIDGVNHKAKRLTAKDHARRRNLPVTPKVIFLFGFYWVERDHSRIDIEGFPESWNRSRVDTSIPRHMIPQSTTNRPVLQRCHRPCYDALCRHSRWPIPHLDHHVRKSIAVLRNWFPTLSRWSDDSRACCGTVTLDQTQSV